MHHANSYLSAEEAIGEIKKILKKETGGVSPEKIAYEVVGFMASHKLNNSDLFMQIFDLAAELELGRDVAVNFDNKWVLFKDVVNNFDIDAAAVYARTHQS
jgi:hypothetical protein